MLVIKRSCAPENFYPATYSKPAFRLLFSGKVTPRKGVLPALQAWREAGLENAEFWIAGRINPEHEKEWRNVVPDNDKFLGFSNNLGDTMRRCHAQILLSSDECQAKSLIEGVACGLPTIATSVTGFTFERGDLGFEVSAEDLTGIARILRRLRNEPDLQRRLSAESARVMLEHYTWPSFRRRFVDKFESGLAIASRTQASGLIDPESTRHGQPIQFLMSSMMRAQVPPSGWNILSAMNARARSAQ